MDYEPQKIISDNKKTDFSLNLPIKGHCHPTEICARTCYAKVGRLCMKHTRRKQAWLSQYLSGHDISRLIQETRRLSQVRLNGSGDLLPEHIDNILHLAEECPSTRLWGMTRKPDIADEINGKFKNLSLLVTVDHSSPERVWADYQGAMCFGPRTPEDTVLPDDDRILVVFPYHCHGKVVKGVQRHPKDCRAVWHEIDGCASCGRCWSWAG